MAKHIREIRDPIHVFVHLEADEREVLDSRQFQRLRHIHQLGLSYLVYPGATHKRFEHSLGVMELAGRVFDVVTDARNVSDKIAEVLPQIKDAKKLPYWRKVLRMAALCHDIGHLPFSHSAEKELLPKGWNHERLTVKIIKSAEMMDIWNHMELDSDHIAKLAVGPEKATGLSFSDWEAILADIIVSDVFGVDRMDYLLRDSHHAGVVYGSFDHYRLIDTLRILPPAPAGKPGEEGQSKEPTLGVEQGGRYSAEALLLARYFMYSQVYFHRVRRIYDIHLRDFLRTWLCEKGYAEGKFPTDVEGLLALTDNEVTSAMLRAAHDEDAPGHEDARRIASHEHFKLLYERNPNDVKTNPDAAEAVYRATEKKFGEGNVRKDSYSEDRKPSVPDFPILLKTDEHVVSAWQSSDVLKHLPAVAVDYVFIAPHLRNGAKDWLEVSRERIIEPKKEEES